MRQTVDQLLSRAKRHARNGEITEAGELYGAVLAEFPNNRRARAGLAALGAAGRPAPAAMPGPAPGQSPTDDLAALFAQGRLEEAVALGEALALERPREAAIFNILGAANARLGRPDKAVESFRRAVEASPHLPESHFNLAIALKNRGDLPAAIENYRRAIDLNPAYAEAHYNLGNALKAVDRSSEAIDSYRQAVAIKPGYAKAHHNLANTLRTAGETGAALESYARALRLQPGAAEIHIDLGNALADLRRHDDAIACYAKALEISPRHRDATGLMGAAMMRIGRQGEGLALQEAGYGVICFDPASGVTLTLGQDAHEAP